MLWDFQTSWFFYKEIRNDGPKTEKKLPLMLKLRRCQCLHGWRIRWDEKDRYSVQKMESWQVCPREVLLDWDLRRRLTIDIRPPKLQTLIHDARITSDPTPPPTCNFRTWLLVHVISNPDPLIDVTVTRCNFRPWFPDTCTFRPWFPDTCNFRPWPPATCNFRPPDYGTTSNLHHLIHVTYCPQFPWHIKLVQN